MPLLKDLPHADRVKLSTIAVDDLAGVLTGLLIRLDALSPGTVLHANHPTPTTLRTLISTVMRNIALPWTTRHTSPGGQAHPKIHTNKVNERHLVRICTDHWYASNRIWRLTDHHPGAGFAEKFPRYASWYRTELSKLG